MAGACLAAALAVAGCGDGSLAPAPCDPTPRDRVCVAGVALTVEIADTRAERETGLSGRDHLSADRGMLFVFDEPDHHAFWMKDTRLVLSIGFANAGGVILNIEALEPLSEELVYPVRPALLALEVNRGWFVDHGIHPGDTLETGPVF